MNTRHAEVRAQQRGIPPMVDQLLDLYGREEHDGRGAVFVYLDKAAIRQMEREMGRRPVAMLAGYHNAFKVKTLDGWTITCGYRTGPVRRK